MTETREQAAEGRQGRKFGAVLGSAFAALSLLLWWRGLTAAASGTAAVAAMLWLGAVAFPRQLLPVERGWMAFAQVVSRVTTPVIMAILYFVVITPMGLGARLFGHYPLRRTAGQSAWIPREPARRKSDLHHQF